MSERSERLFSALNQISDDHIDEAAKPPQRKKNHWKQWGTAAACITLVAVSASIFPHLGGCGASGGGQEGNPAAGGTTFMSYSGPVLPLTLKEANDSIAAERNITLDFAPWVPRWISNEERVAERTDLTPAQRQEQLERYDEWYPEGGSWESTQELALRDQYLLTNTSDKDQTVTVQLPFAASLQELPEAMPRLTMGEDILKATLLAGRPAPNVDFGSWQEYETYLANDTERTQAGTPIRIDREIPVTVYAFTDEWVGVTDPDEVPNPSVQARFDLNFDNTQVLTYGFDGFRSDQEQGEMIREFSIHRGQKPRRQACLLMVLGDDITNLETSCHITGGTDPETPVLENAGVTVTRHQADLLEVLRWILEDWRSYANFWSRDFAWAAMEPSMDEELLYQLLLQQLDQNYGPELGEINRRGGSLEDILSMVNSSDRVFWLEAAITIPAGETVTLQAESRKQPSMDYCCVADDDKESLRGYDLMPWLDSNLSFTAQTALLEDREQVEIVNQNFGFDLEHGVRSVALDPEIPHYYLEVQPRPEPEA